METLKVCLVQCSIHWESVDENLEMFSKKLNDIASCDLIVLPEMFNTGFTMQAESVAEDSEGKTFFWMKQLASAKQCMVTGSYVVSENGKYYNRLLWMKPDGNWVKYDKRHLFRMANEHQHYTAGNEKLIVEIKGWKICPLVCYDLRFPVWSRNKFNQTWEYDCLIYIANWPERRSHAWKTLLQARAIENQCYVIGVNRVGKDGNNISYSGDSALINAKGEVTNDFIPGAEELKIITLNYDELQEYRNIFPVGLDADKFEVIN